ncbi:macro domain-containing protein [bacterium]|jgi:O-acetyl-ADP-ribose deacetylase|nr:macro domain-containing protein [bacterium]MDB4731447.1 macro domain-containing protein [bacterium]
MTQWHVHHGDILDFDADGLLCSANPHLNLSGGVGGAFGLRYGYEMQTFLHKYLRDRSLKYVEPGNAVVAPPCGSPFVAVAHAVSIDAFYDTTPDIIIQSYAAAIQGFAARDCATIAAACLGCGYGRVTVDAFATVATHLFQTHYDNITDITLVTTNAELVERLEPITRISKNL